MATCTCLRHRHAADPCHDCTHAAALLSFLSVVVVRQGIQQHLPPTGRDRRVMRGDLLLAVFRDHDNLRKSCSTSIFLLLPPRRRPAASLLITVNGPQSMGYCEHGRVPLSSVSGFAFLASFPNGQGAFSYPLPWQGQEGFVA